MSAILEVSGLKKTYGSLEILTNLEFKAERGETISIIGPSGCGKSTALKIFGLLESPDSGLIKINGLDCSSISDSIRTKYRKDLLGFIFQHSSLLNEFSAIENIMMPLLIQNKNKKEAYLQACEIMERFGIIDKINVMPRYLSGGEQQRVAIARAIIKKPAIIFADEPTGSLDEASAKKVSDFLFQISTQEKLTLIIVTHNAKLAKAADSIFEMRSGTLYNTSHNANE